MKGFSNVLPSPPPPPTQKPKAPAPPIPPRSNPNNVYRMMCDLDAKLREHETDPHSGAEFVVALKALRSHLRNVKRYF